MIKSDNKVVKHIDGNRRKFLRYGARIGCAGLFIKETEAAGKNQTKFKSLDENDMFDIGDRGKEIIRKAHDLGFEYEKTHRGCARCIVASLQESFDFIQKDTALFRAACCLDGGAAPTKMANCGCFTGSGIFIGGICGDNDFGKNVIAQKLFREVYKRFNKEYGTVLCKDIKTQVEGNCPEVVAKAAGWTAEIVLKQFTNYTG